MSSLNKDAFWAVHTVHFAVGAQRLFSGTARENTSVLFRIWGGVGNLWLRDKACGISYFYSNINKHTTQNFARDYMGEVTA